MSVRKSWRQVALSSILLNINLIIKELKDFILTKTFEGLVIGFVIPWKIKRIVSWKALELRLKLSEPVWKAQTYIVW